MEKKHPSKNMQPYRSFKHRSTHLHKHLWCLHYPSPLLHLPTHALPPRFKSRDS